MFVFSTVGPYEIEIDCFEFQLNFTCFYDGVMACAPFKILSDELIEFTEYFIVSVESSAHIDDINVMSNFLEVQITDSGRGLFFQ